jgi:hypothetical protein
MNETLEHLMSQIEERRKDIIESLGDGAARSFEDYKYAAGTVRGLLTAQSLIADLAKRMENSDE